MVMHCNVLETVKWIFYSVTDELTVFKIMLNILFQRLVRLLNINKIWYGGITNGLVWADMRSDFIVQYTFFFFRTESSLCSHNRLSCTSLNLPLLYSSPVHKLQLNFSSTSSQEHSLSFSQHLISPLNWMLAEWLFRPPQIQKLNCVKPCLLYYMARRTDRSMEFPVIKIFICI